MFTKLELLLLTLIIVLVFGILADKKQTNMCEEGIKWTVQH